MTYKPDDKHTSLRPETETYWNKETNEIFQMYREGSREEFWMRSVWKVAVQTCFCIFQEGAISAIFIDVRNLINLNCLGALETRHLFHYGLEQPSHAIPPSNDDVEDSHCCVQ
ncbi:hypothetical protein NPIL_283001 [Nephila pilipes]|uniref:Uncharacterized protein n=1 Tax=Nephila pilipes TaxID=299642 RepID=A0A8X6PJF7_NEPPI|nr:hypothetical protein NPIL_283001 [Nephila pilipes]